MIIKGSRILTGWKSPTKFFMPDQMQLFKDRVKVTRRVWFGLNREEESISINRIASTRIHYGILKATVVLETYGGGDRRDPWLSGVAKSKARAFREAIQERTASSGHDEDEAAVVASQSDTGVSGD